MNPEMDTPTGPLVVVAIVAWALVLWPAARARVDAYFAARRAARAARSAAPKTTKWRNKW